MSLRTFSKFYYGHTVDETNFAIDFKEGGAELQASIDFGSYTLTEFAAAFAAALNLAGALTYTASVDRVTRKITVTNIEDTNFSLLIATGSRNGSSGFALAGFTGSDLTGAHLYESDSASGSVYLPQFILQDHIPKERNSRAIDAVVNKSAAGITEVVRFGVERLVTCNIRYITNRDMGSDSPIETNATGVNDYEQFMDYAVQKKVFEYMPDRDTPATFDKVILETTPKSSNGTDHETRELVDQSLPGFFESGKLTLRVFM